MAFVATCMDLETVFLSEVSQAGKTNIVSVCMWNLKKWYK